MSDDAQNPSYGQAPGQPGPPPGWQPGPPPIQGGPYGAYPPPKHPQATTVLVLGILGVVLCQVVAPFAWVMGNRAMKEINANPAGYSGQSEVNAGRILGIVGTVILVLGALLLVLAAVVLLVGFSGGGSGDYNVGY